MQTKSARSGMPIGPREVVCQTGHFRPSFTLVVAAEKSGGRDAGKQYVGFARPAQFDVPDAVELLAGVLRKFWVLFRGAPAFAQIRRGNHLATEPGIVGRGKNAAVAPV